jgi:hypothetical protein
MELPMRPEEYSGDSFSHTMTKGGWGEMTSGWYDIVPNFHPSGYKSWGTIGQGAADNMSVAFDTDDLDRYMIVSIVPAYVDQDESNTDRDRIEMEIGAYPFREDEVWEPVSIDDISEDMSAMKYTQVGADGAKALVGATMAALAASTYIF